MRCRGVSNMVKVVTLFTNCLQRCPQRASSAWPCYHWANSTKWLKCYTGVSWLHVISSLILIFMLPSMCHFDQAAVFDWSCLSGVCSLLEQFESAQGNEVLLWEGRRESFSNNCTKTVRFIPLLCLYTLVHFILSIVGASGKLAWQ